ncbi:hypothetical protein F1728_15320 [Gimesia benthica]|uniref:Uncharacterized protein n=1 Tax=Gimesia benthica TaxID=2608982 RepID=A0A6I6AC61_9PLAN|nr:hypothetical protein [Gimesia benthica]QGQ23967.1 hypothetical protein F1728_15320 [Gimesia benthica]
MSENKPSKSIVSVSEMARMVGLSRQRFHQLRGTTFPEPDYDPKTKRPYYNAEKQQVCLDVRQRNCGIDGKPILFYARRNDVGVVRKPHKKKTVKTPNSKFDQIADAIKALGMKTDSGKVGEVINNLFPNGIENSDEAEVIRSVFLQLKQSENDNAGD